MTEREVRMMQPQDKEDKQLEKTKEQISSQHLQKECISANTLILTQWDTFHISEPPEL